MTKDAPAGVSSAMRSLTEPVTQPDRRVARRAARREQNRTEILDAAEIVFGADGIRDGSLRKIADLAGFSTAAIYLFFENKQDLLTQTCIRRADEWDGAVREVAGGDQTPLETLHGIIDVAIGFFAKRPHFRLLLRHIRGGPAITGPVLAEFADSVDARYLGVLQHIARIIKMGQSTGQIRQGSERSLAHLFLVLLNEFALIGDPSDESNVGTLSAEQFHGFIDGALRTDRSRAT